MPSLQMAQGEPKVFFENAAITFIEPNIFTLRSVLLSGCVHATGHLRSHCKGEDHGRSFC